ncbi:hypothetical protein C8R45DRAFT_964440 [Mycena sanguinolenta]|nr:hypothetical protein C8R45DRAFT_964440 [Mycena sanguinolenta]
MDAPQTKVLGPSEIAVLASYALFGVTTSQTYTYFTRFPNDPRILKSLVIFVWSCELAHIVVTANTLYTISVLDFDHPEGLVYVPLPILVSFFINGIIECCVQGFFAFRIYRLSGRRYIPAVIWTLGFTQLLLSVLPLVSGTLQGLIPIAAFETQQTWVVYSTMGVSAANDLIIATTLVYYLYLERAHAARRTIIVIDKLIQWTIETGVITSTAAFLELIFFATMPLNFYWLAVDILLGELFSNSFLASLNSRTMLRTMNEVSVDVSLPLGNITATTESSSGDTRIPAHSTRSPRLEPIKFRSNPDAGETIITIGTSTDSSRSTKLDTVNYALP